MIKEGKGGRVHIKRYNKTEENYFVKDNNWMLNRVHFYVRGEYIHDKIVNKRWIKDADIEREKETIYKIHGIKCT